MTVEFLRDVVIIVYGAVATISIIFVSVLVLSLYLRARRIMDSVQTTSRTVEKFVTFFADQDAITKIVLIIQGIRQGFSSASQFFKGGEKQ